jgi:hypothetical protein
MLQVLRIFNQADQGGQPGASGGHDPFAPIPRGQGVCNDIIFDNTEIVISSVSRCTTEEEELIRQIVEESFKTPQQPT